MTGSHVVLPAAITQDRRRAHGGKKTGSGSNFKSDGNAITRPRWVETKQGPRSDCAAVAPRHKITCGPSAAISAMSHGRHATTSVRRCDSAFMDTSFAARAGEREMLQALA